MLPTPWDLSMWFVVSFSAIIGWTILLLAGQFFKTIAYSRHNILSLPLKKTAGSPPVIASSSVVSLPSGNFFFDTTQIVGSDTNQPSAFPCTTSSVNGFAVLCQCRYSEWDPPCHRYLDRRSTECLQYPNYPRTFQTG